VPSPRDPGERPETSANPSPALGSSPSPGDGSPPAPGGTPPTPLHRPYVGTDATPAGGEVSWFGTAKAVQPTQSPQSPPSGRAAPPAHGASAGATGRADGPDGSQDGAQAGASAADAGAAAENGAEGGGLVRGGATRTIRPNFITSEVRPNDATWILPVTAPI